MKNVKKHAGRAFPKAGIKGDSSTLPPKRRASSLFVLCVNLCRSEWH